MGLTRASSIVKNHIFHDQNPQTTRLLSLLALQVERKENCQSRQIIRLPYSEESGAATDNAFYALRLCVYCIPYRLRDAFADNVIAPYCHRSASCVVSFCNVNILYCIVTLDWFLPCQHLLKSARRTRRKPSLWIWSKDSSYLLVLN